MATSSFKSTTKRTTIGSTGAEDTGSSNRTGSHRRSRSLSQFSGRFPPSDPDELLPNGRFVNTVRGSGFPEISLDDLANEFFPSRDDGGRVERESARGRLDRRASAIGAKTAVGSADASQRRGRSVSRSHGKGSLGNNSASRSVSRSHGKGSLGNNSLSNGVYDNSSRRRRSVSVARYQCSDSESDMDHSHSSSNLSKSKSSGNGNFERHSLHKPTVSSNQRPLRRSMSQKDLLRTHDGYSSYSSALTDDEAQDGHNRYGLEKTIRAVYAQKKTEHPTGDGEGTGVYEAMRKEVWHALDEMRMELEQVMVKTKPTMLANGDCLQPKSSDVIQALADARKNYTTKLVQSEKRTQDLLAELAVEEQRGREFTKIVRELLPDPPKQSAAPEKPIRARKRSNDKTRVSKRLTEEAEKYFEDFISNVEDTDFSSFDGEKSDTSSTLGGSIKSKDPVTSCTNAETGGTPVRASSLPVGIDGVILPWLQWETSNDNSPLPCKNQMKVSVALENKSFDTAQEANASYSNCAASSRASWSPDGNENSSTASRGKMSSRFVESGGYPISYAPSKQRGSSFDMDEYLDLRKEEDLLFERLRQRQRIVSGGLILCDRILL
ncbi:uncharacterized protein LOC131256057 isoform X2 [Magnolia sinica]|uniref:uncharacterized protein LOC131256057 isoform X2 n=1 Tax=Magnolia sinica TaxID=86752 RepID=UPI0026587C9A|nr:uncharacterized protein LOC131256057 isoform X2 [Magnolia sinica]